MTPAEMRARITEIDAIVTPLKQERAELALALAQATATYHAGDILERQKRYGYSHPPRYRTERVQVIKVVAGWRDSPKTLAKPIKANGQLGERTIIVYDNDKEWHKVEVASASSGDRDVAQ